MKNFIICFNYANNGVLGLNVNAIELCVKIFTFLVETLRSPITFKILGPFTIARLTLK